MKLASLPSTLIHIGWPILPRVRSEKKEAFFQTVCHKSRSVPAVYWWRIAEAVASDCRIKLASLPSILTHLSRRSCPKCAQAKEEAFFQNVCHKSRSVLAVCWCEVDVAAASD
jgi:hypothetical protein